MGGMGEEGVEQYVICGVVHRSWQGRFALRNIFSLQFS